VRFRSILRTFASLLLAGAFFWPWVAHADMLDDGVRRVALQLQCPVCEGESVADSPSGLATDMRSLIRARLAAGVSDQQILDEFVASYGDSILTEPPKHGISLGVWLGPTIAVALGAILLGVLLWTWRRAPGRGGAGNGTADSALDPDVADEFRRFREEFGR
jgi:cytochrome c-type biogenesis protein CcmH